MPVEVIVEEAAVAAAGEEVAAAAEAGAVAAAAAAAVAEAAAVAAAAAAAAAAAVAAAEEEVVVVVTMTMTTMMMMMMMMGHLSVYQVPPIVERDVGFSTIKKWNNNSLKSYKINDRWPRGDGSLASRPPIPSRPRIRMDGGLPSHADRRVYGTKKCYEVKSTGSLDSSLTAHYNRMDRIIVRAFKTHEQLYHEHPGQFTEWLLRQIRG